MKTIKYKGEVFQLDNISECKFEIGSPAKIEMNPSSKPELPKQAILIITFTNGTPKTFFGQDANEFKKLLPKKLFK
jgi:hypothetical protein